MVGRLRTLAWLGELILGAVGSRAESPKPRQPRIARQTPNLADRFFAITERLPSYCDGIVKIAQNGEEARNSQPSRVFLRRWTSGLRHHGWCV